MKSLKLLGLITILTALILTFCACQSEAERYYDEAISLRDQGKDIEALIALNKTLDLEIDDADYFAKRASLYDELNDPEQAIEDYSSAITIEPKAEFYNGRAFVYKSIHEFEKAIADYNEAIAIDPQLDEAYVWRGKCHHALGQYELYYDARYYYALDQEAKKHYELALEDINEAIRLNPDAGYQAARALVYIDMEQYERAIDDYDEAISLDPKASYFEYRAGAHFIIGQYEQAIKDCDEVIRLGSQNADPYLIRGNSYIELGQYGKAIEDLDEVISILPKFYLAYIQRANAYIELGQYDNAVKEYNEALVLQPDLADNEILEDMKTNGDYLKYYAITIEKVKQVIEEYQANSE